MNSLPHSSGIYKIVCIPTGKIYVGSTNDFYQRWKSHRSELKRGVHHSRYLQFSWNKYGEAAFAFEIIELVMPWSIIDREDYWFEVLKPFAPNGFNSNPTADKPPSPKGRIVSQATREKLRIASTGKHNGLGRKHTTEAIEKFQ